MLLHLCMVVSAQSLPPCASSPLNCNILSEAGKTITQPCIYGDTCMTRTSSSGPSAGECVPSSACVLGGDTISCCKTNLCNQLAPTVVGNLVCNAVNLNGKIETVQCNKGFDTCKTETFSGAEVESFGSCTQAANCTMGAVVGGITTTACCTTSKCNAVSEITTPPTPASGLACIYDTNIPAVACPAGSDTCMVQTVTNTATGAYDTTGSCDFSSSCKVGTTSLTTLNGTFTTTTHTCCTTSGCNTFPCVDTANPFAPAASDGASGGRAALSGGDIAGIVIACLAVVGLVVVGLVVLHRRQHTQGDGDGDGDGTAYIQMQSEKL